MDTEIESGRGRYVISELQGVDNGRWDAFVQREGGSFFHLSGWKNILENELGHPTRYLMCQRAGQLAGVLPLAHIKSWLFGSALISTPFLVYGGAVAMDEAAEQALVSAALEIARDLGVDRLELRNRRPSSRGWPQIATHATFRKEMSSDPDANLKSIPRKQRAMIRKGAEAGLSAVTDDSVDRLYTSLLECKRNLGTPFFGRRYLRAIKEQFGEKAEIMTVEKDGSAVASVLSFRHQNEILPYYGGGGGAARALKANDYMYWAVMRKACQEGVEIFDFGRSLIGSGAYRFKKHWGFEPVPLPYDFHPIQKEGAPNLNPTNPKYGLLIKAWKKLPLPVAARIGPPLARRLG